METLLHAARLLISWELWPMSKWRFKHKKSQRSCSNKYQKINSQSRQFFPINVWLRNVALLLSNSLRNASKRPFHPGRIDFTSTGYILVFIKNILTSCLYLYFRWGTSSTRYVFLNVMLRRPSYLQRRPMRKHYQVPCSGREDVALKIFSRLSFCMQCRMWHNSTMSDVPFSGARSENRCAKKAPLPL